MPRRHLVQLAYNVTHLKDENWHRDPKYKDWRASEKLDGHRALWDGVSRGIPAHLIEWAADNDPEDTCTGLFSRTGKIIHAPDSWLDQLPPGVPMDGELYLGRQSLQKTSSIVRTDVPDDLDWDKIRYCVFDIPDMSQILEEGEVYLRRHPTRGNVVLKLTHKALVTYMSNGGIVVDAPFETRYQTLFHHYPSLCHYQELPPTLDTAEEIKAGGGEGLIIRDPEGLYVPWRTEQLLKIKPLMYAYAIVLAEIRGTNRNADRVGALEVLCNSLERTFNINVQGDAAREWGTHPPNTKIEFSYRELSDNGIPLEPIYVRKLENDWILGE